MMWLDSVLIGAAVLAALSWAALSAFLLTVQRRRTKTRDALNATLTTLEQLRGADSGTRLEAVRRLLGDASRELLMRCAAERTVSVEAFDTLVAFISERWSLESLVSDASQHATPRDRWRRITSLRILARLAHPQVIDLLACAAEDPDNEVMDCGLALLGQSSDPRASDRLLAAMASRRGSAARVAVYLDQSPRELGSRLVRLLDHMDPVVRQFSAALLARYPAEPDGGRLARLTRDSEPNVRKAAIQTLGLTGRDEAVGCAVALLADEVPYVRAHAARALGRLQSIGEADRVSALLGDRDWWVRLAARESLEDMGTEVWPVLVRCLDSPDRFVRNGAAEVIQNLGVLDNLIVLAAATDYPTRSKLDMLKRITDAGGVRLTASLVERAGPIIGPRVRALLDSIGFEHVGAA